ncbi:MAG: hypothetical protein ACREAW_08050 [Nitrososphaera sp.]
MVFVDDDVLFVSVALESEFVAVEFCDSCAASVSEEVVFPFAEELEVSVEFELAGGEEASEVAVEFCATAYGLDIE